MLKNEQTFKNVFLYYSSPSSSVYNAELDGKEYSRKMLLEVFFLLYNKWF